MNPELELKTKLLIHVTKQPCERHLQQRTESVC